MNKRKDIVGMRFGRLMVVENRGAKNGNSYWLCKCDCGNEVTVSAPHLKSGHTKSCGCIRRETAPKQTFRHGLSETRLYRIWAGMIQRCTNKRSKSYQWYGGKGIRVCDEWKDFIAFKDWAMEAGYNDGLTIDRIDNDGMYCPGNCRWVTIEDQQKNRSNALPLVYARGQKKSIADWANETGMSYSKIHGRIYSLGYSPEMALKS